jgi:hypothetical protein
MTTGVLEVDLRDQLLRDLRGGAEGINHWNARPEAERQAAGPFHGADLSGAMLAEVNLACLDLQGARFEQANLAGAWLLECGFSGASFQGANLDRAWCAAASFHKAILHGASLAGANLRGCDCRGATFTDANLEKATLDSADLCGADLSGARMRGASVWRARYDGQTRFPRGFEPGEAMDWIGGGPPPIAFDVFVNRLREHVDPRRLARAVEMLKAERFQLYSQVEDGALAGVVKSQTEEGLVYSCRLAADGRFHCCNQQLAPCLGLRSALCKHLLVLAIGLTRSNQADAAAVLRWAQASRRRKPGFDLETMSEPLLRYKGVEAGRLDWRPTETIPEDYYAL